MAATLGAISGATQLLLGANELSIDNWTFRFFYRWSVITHIAASVLVACNQLFGNPIQCDLPGGGVDEKVLKAYCWMYSTFNIPPGFEGQCARREQSDSPMYNSYYQWVPIVLTVQALLFYVPRVLWLMIEGDLMKYLGKGRVGKFIEDEDEKMSNLLSAFKEQLFNKYNRYAFYFFGCEFLNFVIAVLQIFITNIFLRGKFLLYGPQTYRFYQLPPEESMMMGILNPMCEVFPRVASCTYWRYGSGGRQSGFQALCILSLNIIIDKVYLVLWFWYVLVSILGGIRVLCRVVQIISPKIRFWMMKMRMYRYFKKSEAIESVEEYLRECKIGDWFVLYQMSKNLNRRFFYDFLIKLSAETKRIKNS